MTKPVRVQLRRVKGWKMPPNTVRVSRPSKWGNPFSADHGWQASFRALAFGERGDRAGRLRASVKIYRLWVTAKRRRIRKDKRDFWEKEVLTLTPGRLPPSIDEIRAELRGKNLACWCKIVDQHGSAVPCHADVLLSLANDIPIDEVIRENLRRAEGEAAQ